RVLRSKRCAPPARRPRCSEVFSFVSLLNGRGSRSTAAHERGPTPTAHEFLQRLAPQGFFFTCVPDCLCLCSSCTSSDIQPPFKLAAPQRHRKTNHEIQGRGASEIQERLEGRVIEYLGVIRKLSVAYDERGDRCVLDNLNHEADRRWRSD